MATKRIKPSGKWEFFVKHKLLEKTWSHTFVTEAEGDTYCAQLEAYLKAGKVPPELSNQRDGREIVFISQAIKRYIIEGHVNEDDVGQLARLVARIGGVKVVDADYKWVKEWVTSMKQADHMSPSTIKKYVGVLRRCFDWCRGEGVVALVVNPLHMLPKKYAHYTKADVDHLRPLGKVARIDIHRDRRLEPGEEENVRAVFAGRKVEGKQRVLALHHQPALDTLFELALESAMRLSEMYTLTRSQVDLSRATIFLEKTKNGDKRAVPLTTVAVARLQRYIAQVESDDAGMGDFKFSNDQLFPWWDGKLARDGTPDKLNMRKTTAKLSAQFARIFAAAGCPDFKFHDLRHEATSRLFVKTRLLAIEIAKITGHKNMQSLMRYLNLRPSELASRLW